MDTDNKDKVVKRKWWKWPIRLVMTFLILVITSTILLQLPPVQTYLSKKVASMLSDKMTAQVTLDYINLSIVDGLVLKGFNVATLQGDSVLSTTKLTVSLRKTLWSIFDNQLAINNVKLYDPYLNLVITKGETSTNLEIMLSKLFDNSDQGDSQKSNFSIALKDIAINNISFKLDNKNNGTRYSLKSNELRVKLDSFNTQTKNITCDQLFLNKPIISVIKYENTLPIGETQLNEINTTSNSTIAKEEQVSMLIVKSFIIKDGIFTKRNLLNVNPSLVNNFDSENFEIKDFDLSISSLKYDAVSGLDTRIEKISFLDDKNFQLTQLNIERLLINDHKIDLQNFYFKTPNSEIKRNATLTYNTFADLSDFINKVNIDSHFDESTIAIKELAYFLPAIQNLTFFKKNINKTINLSSHINGRINNLNVEKLILKIDDKISLAGSIKLTNMTKPNLLNIKIVALDLSTSIMDLKDIIPGFIPSKNLETLGKMSFIGLIEGNTNKFSLDGQLKSQIGFAELKGNLDISKGSEAAKYNGDLNLQNFDLKTFIDNDDFGLTSLTLKIEDGYSFNPLKIRSKLVGKIQNFEFKGYKYTNVDLNGLVENGSYTGKILSLDPNANLDFDGLVVYSKDNLDFKFNTLIRHIDFQKLNISKNPFGIEGNFSIEGHGMNLNDFVGNFKAGNLKIIKSDSTYTFTDLVLTSTNKANGGKNISIKNDEINLDIDGKIDFNTIVFDIKSIIKNGFPRYTESWIIDQKLKTYNQIFRYDISLKDFRPFANFFDLDGSEIIGLKAKGSVNSAKDELQIVSSIPFIKHKNDTIFSTSIIGNVFNQKGEINIRFDSSSISNYKLKNVEITGQLEDINLKWSITSKKLLPSIDNVDLRGLIIPKDGRYEVKITNNDVKIFDQRWKLNPDNSVIYGKEFLDISNFNITDGNRTIELEDVNNKGLLLRINRFRFNAINSLINDPKYKFGGEVVTYARVNNVFEKSPDIYGTFLINNFTINGDSYGNLNLDISKPVNENLEAILSLENEKTKQALKANINFNPDTKELNSTIKGRRIPIKFLEYILAGGISKVEGYANIDGVVSGTTSNTKLDATATFYNGKVKINYLGETYSFNNQKLKLTEKYIDFTGAILNDSEKNQGVVTGGMSHDLFRKFILDANISGENVIALNTTKEENPVYYGKGIGRVSVDIKGPVDRANMTINALTRAGTVINMPLTNVAVNPSQSIVTFVTREEFLRKNLVDNQKEVNISGLNIIMNITMTNDALVNLIFDEFKGDVIRGRGNGNIRVVSPRAELLEIFGEYEIESGEYLFTSKGIIAKPFIVRRGGLLRWTGDPLNASINFEADYLVRASLNTFLGEFLYSDALRNAASTRTDVNVKLIIGNTLFNPSIKFDFEFPLLNGELKSYANTKVRLLKNNESDFNGQVFSLLIWNSFLPSNEVSGITNNAGILQSAGINTISEFLSSQVSLFVTSLINEALEDNGLVSGVDFNLNLRNGGSLTNSTNNVQDGFLPSEIEVRLNPRFRFLDERLSLNLGGNYVRQSSVGVQNYIVPDFSIEYALKADKSIILKLYARYDLDAFFLSRRQQYGVGLRFRTEFGPMLETETDLNDFFKRNIAAKK
jgi:hypothetical protein